jgi:protein-S-isoprenylcysteine O-methyltransferase Ste14
MGRLAPVAPWVVALVVVVVVVDVFFFRHLVWERLMANAGIVLLFGAFYLRYAARG